MSELINNNKEKLQSLKDYAIAMLNGEQGATLYKQYENILKQVTPREVITIVDALVKTNEDITDVKRTTNKILNIFYDSIKSYGRFEPDPGSFLYYLMLENEEMDRRLKDLRVNIKKVFAEKDKRAALKKYKNDLKKEIEELLEYEKHWVKKENILFPFIENYFDDYRCLTVMWSMHDDSRESIRALLENLEREEPYINEFNQNIGKLYYSVLPVIFREEYILFPVAARAIKPDDWTEMLAQSKEEGFAFIKGPDKYPQTKQDKQELSNTVTNTLVDLGTGRLKPEDIMAVFNHLPVDITYVDENDRVKYFSTPKHRIFPRSKAVIGRTVQNCHPPESVHIVNQIVDSFKAGKKDVESFWIQYKGKFILIQYYAVRNEAGEYKGVIEVSQDVTWIRSLEGEKRLLDW